MMRFIPLFALVVLLGAASTLERMQHQFRTGETIGFQSSIEMNEGPTVRRQDVSLQLTVKSVDPTVEFDAQETLNRETNKTQLSFHPSSGTFHNRKGDDIALFSPLLIAYSPTLWGALPPNVERGSTWSTDSPAWIFGPAGHETVTVTAYNAATRTMALSIVGSGTGPTRGEIENPDSLMVSTRASSSGARTRMSPRKTEWRETVEISDGLLARARIDVHADYEVPQSSVAPQFRLTRRITENVKRM
jgi:hypothetical protein